MLGSFTCRNLDDFPRRSRCLCQSCLAQKLRRCPCTVIRTPTRRSQNLCHGPEIQGPGAYRLGYVPRGRNGATLELLFWSSRIGCIVSPLYAGRQFHQPPFGFVQDQCRNTVALGRDSTTLVTTKTKGVARRPTSLGCYRPKWNAFDGVCGVARHLAWRRDFYELWARVANGLGGLLFQNPNHGNGKKSKPRKRKRLLFVMRFVSSPTVSIPRAG
jgi:hypothetical protein